MYRPRNLLVSRLLFRHQCQRLSRREDRPYSPLDSLPLRQLPILAECLLRNLLADLQVSQPFSLHRGLRVIHRVDPRVNRHRNLLEDPQGSQPLDRAGCRPCSHLHNLLMRRLPSHQRNRLDYRQHRRVISPRGNRLGSPVLNRFRALVRNQQCSLVDGRQPSLLSNPRLGLHHYPRNIHRHSQGHLPHLNQREDPLYGPLDSLPVCQLPILAECHLRNLLADLQASQLFSRH